MSCQDVPSAIHDKWLVISYFITSVMAMLWHDAQTSSTQIVRSGVLCFPDYTQWRHGLGLGGQSQLHALDFCLLENCCKIFLSLENFF